MEVNITLKPIRQESIGTLVKESSKLEVIITIEGGTVFNLLPLFSGWKRFSGRELRKDFLYATTDQPTHSDIEIICKVIAEQLGSLKFNPVTTLGGTVASYFFYRENNRGEVYKATFVK